MPVAEGEHGEAAGAPHQETLAPPKLLLPIS